MDKCKAYRNQKIAVLFLQRSMYCPSIITVEYGASYFLYLIRI